MKKNFIVNVLATTHDITNRPISALGQQIVLFQFGPCSKEEGEELAEHINAWCRGGVGGGPKEMGRLLRSSLIESDKGDVLASCEEMPSTNVSELLEDIKRRGKRFRV